MLDRFFPDDMVASQCDPRTAQVELLPEEQALVARAVSRRQREFAAARGCAREALGHFGITNVPLLSAPTREPLWPAGIVGSISHTDGLCAVVVARACTYASVGIDVEPARPLPANIVARVCRADEGSGDDTISMDLGRGLGMGLGRGLGMGLGVVQRMRFSAKEAIYKCQFLLTRTFVGFHDVAVRFECDGSFSTHVFPALPRLQECGRLVGRWSCHDGFLLTGVWIEHPTDGRTG